MPTAYSPREMLARLVAFPTVSTRSNLDLVGFVEAYLAGHGVASFRDPDASGDKASLVALVGPAAEGGVVLSGHTDVVPVEGQPWTSDPFALAARDGRLHGRGACDMKGFLACALAAVPAMQAAGLAPPDHPRPHPRRGDRLHRRAADDRGDARRLPRPEAVIVGEPSEMRVVTGQKGSWGFRARVRGHEVHSSLLHTGVSAVMEAAGMIDWMRRTMDEARPRHAAERLRPALHHDPRRPDRRRHRQQHHRPRLHASPARSAACPTRASPPGASASSPRPRAAAPRCGRSTPTPASSSRPGWTCPASPADGPAEALARALTGDNARHVVSYQTEAGHFQDRGLSTVICGPGSIAQAHQPDEFITEAQLAAGSAFVHRLIDRLAA